MDRTMEQNIVHLNTKIRMTEDRLLRSKNVYEQQEISTNLQKLRVQLQKMQYGKIRACS